jgi:hypothetical protein
MARPLKRTLKLRGGRPRSARLARICGLPARSFGGHGECCVAAFMVKFSLPKLCRQWLFYRGRHTPPCGRGKASRIKTVAANDFRPARKILDKSGSFKLSENLRRNWPKTSLKLQRQLQACLVRFASKAV